MENWRKEEEGEDEGVGGRKGEGKGEGQGTRVGKGYGEGEPWLPIKAQ